MVYTKAHDPWVDGEAGGTRIDAADLNQIEQGIADAHDDIAALGSGATAPRVDTRGSDLHFLATGSQNSSLAITLSYLYCFPVSFFAGLPIRQMAVSVSQLTSQANIKFGIWDYNDDDGTAGTLLSQAALTITGTGANSAVMPAYTPRHTVWIGFVQQSGDMQIRSANNNGIYRQIDVYRASNGELQGNPGVHDVTGTLPSAPAIAITPTSPTWPTPILYYK